MPAPCLSPHGPESTTIRKALKIKQLKIVHVNEPDNLQRVEPAMTSIRNREPDIGVQVLLKNH